MGNISRWALLTTPWTQKSLEINPLYKSNCQFHAHLKQNICRTLKRAKWIFKKGKIEKWTVWLVVHIFGNISLLLNMESTNTGLVSWGVKWISVADLLGMISWDKSGFLSEKFVPPLRDWHVQIYRIIPRQKAWRKKIVALYWLEKVDLSLCGPKFTFLDRGIFFCHQLIIASIFLFD